jgi:hypothetical protein
MRAAWLPATPPPSTTTRAGGHPAQQQPLAGLRLHQAPRRHRHGHAPGDLAHRRQQRQAAIGRGDGLVGDGGAARGQQRLGQRPVGREVQVGEQGLARLQPPAFHRLRLLDLDDEAGVGKQRLDVGLDAGPGRDVKRVVEAGARPGPRLDHHLMSARDQLAHTRRRECHAVFTVLDLARYSDAHDGSRAPHKFRDATSRWARAKKSPDQGRG